MCVLPRNHLCDLDIMMIADFFSFFYIIALCDDACLYKLIVFSSLLFITRLTQFHEIYFDHSNSHCLYFLINPMQNVKYIMHTTVTYHNCNIIINDELR